MDVVKGLIIGSRSNVHLLEITVYDYVYDLLIYIIVIPVYGVQITIDPPQTTLL